MCFNLYEYTLEILMFSYAKRQVRCISPPPEPDPLITVVVREVRPPSLQVGGRRGGLLMDSSATLECPKNLVGRVIGRGGETINELQNKSGTRIQIEQTSDPCKVVITGSVQAVQIGVQMVTAVMSHGPTRSHSAQPPPGFGGMGFPPGYGGYGGMHGYHPHMPPPGWQGGYPPGYGMPPGFAPPGYGMGYGMPPPGFGIPPGYGMPQGYPGMGGPPHGMPMQGHPHGMPEQLHPEQQAAQQAQLQQMQQMQIQQMAQMHIGQQPAAPPVPPMPTVPAPATPAAPAAPALPAAPAVPVEPPTPAPASASAPAPAAGAVWQEMKAEGGAARCKVVASPQRPRATAGLVLPLRMGSLLEAALRARMGSRRRVAAEEGRRRCSGCLAWPQGGRRPLASLGGTSMHTTTTSYLCTW